jgi:hypothetical protein
VGKDLEVIPAARRLITSLRDMGYDFAAAVSDLVDNSIEAGATSVSIDLEFDGDDSWVRIADNGSGMKPAKLREAMRYGSEREYEEDDLGKFGLGLKVASLSQCQRLTVASRSSREKADIAAYCWDLDHVSKTNRWELLELAKGELGSVFREPLAGNTGTVVVWQRLDRLLGYQHPYGEHARKRLLNMCRDTETYLAMVFHRFLRGEAKGKRKLKISINGNEVKPWDPFVTTESETKKLNPIPIRLEHDGQTGYVLLEPFVLPHHNKFSSQEAFKAAAGPNNWNQQQGFYIYRADRLIQSGGWSRMRTVDEHTKLARVALRFSPQLDEAFKVNVAKMRVQLPQQIRDQIEQCLKPVIKLAQEIYRKEGVRTADGGATTTAHAASAAMGMRQDSMATARTRRIPEAGQLDEATFRLAIKELISAANVDERAVIKTVSTRAMALRQEN